MTKEDFLKMDAVFASSFHESPTKRFVSYGRLELLGNHTDHQGGKCLVATCSLAVKASVCLSEEVSLISEGYESFSFSIEDLSLKEEEASTSLALTKGCLSYLKEKGFRIGGFKAILESDIFPGAGVSSSAAFEMLIMEIENVLYNDGKIDKATMAKGGQYAENVYFGKPSGLLDQCGSIFGGVSYVDFFDPQNPRIESVPFPEDWNLALYLVNPGGSHAGLNGLYAKIPEDMKNAAWRALGKKRLADCDYFDFLKASFDSSFLEPRELKRALHYFGEVKRVERSFKALKENNRSVFLELVRETELSQEALLENVMVWPHFKGSPFEGVALANTLLKEGSARVMGGGFFGSVLCFVPREEESRFVEGMRSYYGEKALKEVSIPSCGAHEVKL